MPRYVILVHDKPTLHWDLMLESGDVLKTWRLLVEPTFEELLRGPVAAEEIDDHRPAYLDYEGPVSGDRGSVIRFDQGTFDAQRTTDNWQLHLRGKHLLGHYSLRREDGLRWTLERSENQSG